MANVGHRNFATLQIELYRVVDYDSKWSTKFYKDCMFEFFVIITFKTSYDNVFLNFQNSIMANVGHRVFATHKLNGIV